MKKEIHHTYLYLWWISFFMVEIFFSFIFIVININIWLLYDGQVTYIDTYIINLFIQKKIERKQIGTSREIMIQFTSIKQNETKWKFRFFQNDKLMKNVWKSFTFDEMINIRIYHHYHYIDRQWHEIFEIITIQNI